MKRPLVAFLKGIIPVIVALVFVVSGSGCQQQEGTMEKAGKKIDQSVEATKDTMKQAGETVKKEAEKTVEATKDTMKQAGETIKEGAEKTKEAVTGQKGTEKAQK